MEALPQIIIKDGWKQIISIIFTIEKFVYF